MIEWMRKAIPYHLFLQMKWSGQRMPAAELEKHHVIVKACANAEETVREAVAFARNFKKPRQTLAEMKKRTYRHIIEIMENEDPKYIDPPFFMLTR
jgi:enoyl-CoA hydratase/carnithine racemase